MFWKKRNLKEELKQNAAQRQKLNNEMEWLLKQKPLDFVAMRRNSKKYRLLADRADEIADKLGRE